MAMTLPLAYFIYETVPLQTIRQHLLEKIEFYYFFSKLVHTDFLRMKKREFGSFHVSNVQQLLHLPQEIYEPPDLPVCLPQFDEYSSAPFQFGASVKKKHFLLEEECVFLNHGAFGAVLKEVLQAAQSWQVYTERQPLRFLDRQLLPLLVYVMRRLAQFVGCEATDLVLVPNVTTGVNCVLRSLHLKKGESIFILSICYGAVKKAVAQVCLETGATVYEASLRLPLHDSQQICRLVEAELPSNCRLAIFDHIPSNTPFILPVKEIAQICHERNIPVLIDGAHALGSLPLHLMTLGVDYYVSNAHKWFCAPKGSAFMYVEKSHQSYTRPLVISHGFGSGFNSEFIWTGLRDYSPFLALLSSLDFWERVGPENIHTYIHGLARRAGELLTERWQTQLVAPLNMFGSMVCVRLPAALYNDFSLVTYDLAEAIQNALYHNFNIEVPIKAIEGHLYVRISAHIYNTLEDYELLAKAIEQLTNDQSWRQDIAT